eukprot:2499344-Prymnesium_polylepis.1
MTEVASRQATPRTLHQAPPGPPATVSWSRNHRQPAVSPHRTPARRRRFPDDPVRRLPEPPLTLHTCARDPATPQALFSPAAEMRLCVAALPPPPRPHVHVGIQMVWRCVAGHCAQADFDRGRQATRWPVPVSARAHLPERQEEATRAPTAGTRAPTRRREAQQSRPPADIPSACRDAARRPRGGCVRVARLK